MTFKNYEHTNHTNTRSRRTAQKAVQEFQPNPRRVPFNGLKPVHDIIVDLHRRNASYATIADLLQRHGIKTSRARVAEYGRIVFDGGKKRKRRKQAGAAPIVNIPAAQSTPTVAVKPTPSMPAPGGCVSKQCHVATKRKFSISLTRPAYRQRENDGSGGSQGI